MKLKSTHLWSCDTCNVEGVGTEYHAPKGWREFRLQELEQWGSNGYAHNTLIEFCICEKCHGDIYHNMHPIRKALTLAGVFKKK